LLTQANHDDAGRPIWRVLNHIRESTIKGHQHTPFGSGHREQPVIGNASQSLITSRHGIVASVPENRPDGVRYVLIELDRWHRYAAGMGTIVSRAKSAAYANAAGIASLGNVG
jgi:hypothetical protein